MSTTMPISDGKNSAQFDRMMLYLWFSQTIKMEGFDQVQASFTVPTKYVMPPGVGSLHLILPVTEFLCYSSYQSSNRVT